VNAPPIVLEVLAVHDVALVEVHCSFTPWPKLMVVACEGDEKLTVGIGVGGGGIGIGALYPPPPLPPQPTSRPRAIPGTAATHNPRARMETLPGLLISPGE
jgi:hypothetical protein